MRMKSSEIIDGGGLVLVLGDDVSSLNPCNEMTAVVPTVFVFELV